LDAFCLVPLSLRSIWRRRVAPNLNQKVENATLKNYSVQTGGMQARRPELVKILKHTVFSVQTTAASYKGPIYPESVLPPFASALHSTSPPPLGATGYWKFVRKRAGTRKRGLRSIYLTGGKEEGWRQRGGISHIRQLRVSRIGTKSMRNLSSVGRALRCRNVT